MTEQQIADTLWKLKQANSATIENPYIKERLQAVQQALIELDGD